MNVVYVVNIEKGTIQDVKTIWYCIKKVLNVYLTRPTALKYIKFY